MKRAAYKRLAEKLLRGDFNDSCEPKTWESAVRYLGRWRKNEVTDHAWPIIINQAAKKTGVMHEFWKST